MDNFRSCNQPDCDHTRFLFLLTLSNVGGYRGPVNMTPWDTAKAMMADVTSRAYWRDREYDPGRFYWMDLGQLEGRL